MRYDDGIPERTPEQCHAENIRGRIRLRTEIEARRGRIHGVYCHDLPQLGVLLPKQMQEALGVSSEAYHRAMHDGEPAYRVGGAWRVTRAGRPWTLALPAAHCCTAVVCMSTGVKYPSIKDAADAHGFKHSTLREAIRTGRLAKGLRFKRLDTGQCGTKPPKPYRMPVLCVETGVVYAGTYDAARAVGGRSSGIHRAMSKGMRHMGFHWRFGKAVAA